YNDAANQQRLPGYGLLNLRAGWEFAPQWSLRLTLDNVLDNTFTTAQGQEFDPVSFASTSFDYINAGRAGFLSVHYGQ
ncbi:MAG: TonB-dependent receptor, partial [Halomonas sp.]